MNEEKEVVNKKQSPVLMAIFIAIGFIGGSALYDGVLKPLFFSDQKKSYTSEIKNEDGVVTEVELSGRDLVSYSTKEGGFSSFFFKKPTYTVNTTAVPDSDLSIRAHTYSSEVEDGYYAVTVTKYPEDPLNESLWAPEELDLVVDGMMRSISNSKINEKEYLIFKEMNGVEITTIDSATEYHGKWLILGHGQKMFIIALVSENETFVKDNYPILSESFNLFEPNDELE